MTGRLVSLRLGLYVLAFLLMVVAGLVIVAAVHEFLSSTRLLWVSVTLSALAIAAAIASAVWPAK